MNEKTTTELPVDEVVVSVSATKTDVQSSTSTGNVHKYLSGHVYHGRHGRKMDNG